MPSVSWLPRNAQIHDIQTYSSNILVSKGACGLLGILHLGKRSVSYCLCYGINSVELSVSFTCQQWFDLAPANPLPLYSLFPGRQGVGRITAGALQGQEGEAPVVKPCGNG